MSLFTSKFSCFGWCFGAIVAFSLSFDDSEELDSGAFSLSFEGSDELESSLSLEDDMSDCEEEEELPIKMDFFCRSGLFKVLMVQGSSAICGSICCYFLVIGGSIFFCFFSIGGSIFCTGFFGICGSFCFTLLSVCGYFSISFFSRFLTGSLLFSFSLTT